jgi:hypothetical protein
VLPPPKRCTLGRLNFYPSTMQALCSLAVKLWLPIAGLGSTLRPQWAHQIHIATEKVDNQPYGIMQGHTKLQVM